jgi:serine/threonine protein kinase
VALKAIRPSIAGNPEVLARFKKEVHIARHLAGPNLCRIHELFVGGPDGREVFLTMELLEGITLADEIRNNGSLPWAKAKAIATGICAALASMHDAGIIHRDVKTRNVMLSMRNGAAHPVLMDFGLAREVVSPGPQSDTALSMPGTLLGTPSCMAPEQFSGGALTPATDIYAMGVVLYEMVTGQAPFPAIDVVRAAIMRARTPVPASKMRPELPHGLDRVIAKCLEVEPQRRYQSAPTWQTISMHPPYPCANLRQDSPLVLSGGFSLRRPPSLSLPGWRGGGWSQIHLRLPIRTHFPGMSRDYRRCAKAATCKRPANSSRR